MTPQFVAQVLVILLPLLVPPLALLILWVVPLIRARVKNKLVADLLAGLATVAGIVVAHASQTVVQNLKDPSRPGTWDAQTAAAVKAVVLRDLRELGAQELEQLRTLRKLDGPTVDKLLEQLVEAKVLELKHGAPVILSAADPNPNGGAS